MDSLFSDPLANANHPQIYLPHFTSSDYGRVICFYMIGTHTTDGSASHYMIRFKTDDVSPPVPWMYIGLNDYNFIIDVYASTTYKLTFYGPGKHPWNTLETINNSCTLETVGTLAAATLSTKTDTRFVKSVNYSS